MEEIFQEDRIINIGTTVSSMSSANQYVAQRSISPIPSTSNDTGDVSSIVSNTVLNTKAIEDEVETRISNRYVKLFNYACLDSHRMYIGKFVKNDWYLFYWLKNYTQFKYDIPIYNKTNKSHDQHINDNRFKQQFLSSSILIDNIEADPLPHQTCNKKVKTRKAARTIRFKKKTFRL